MRPNYSDYQLLFGDFTKIPESGFDRWMIRSIGEINRYLCRPLEEIEEEDKDEEKDDELVERWLIKWGWIKPTGKYTRWEKFLVQGVLTV